MQADSVRISAQPAGPDTVAPVISSVASTGVTARPQTVSWTTNEAADSRVEYGATTAYGSMYAAGRCPRHFTFGDHLGTPALHALPLPCALDRCRRQPRHVGRYHLYHDGPGHGTSHRRRDRAGPGHGDGHGHRDRRRVRRRGGVVCAVPARWRERGESRQQRALLDRAGTPRAPPMAPMFSQPGPSMAQGARPRLRR